MAYQFLHLDTVSRSVPKKAMSTRWSMRDILAEAGREPAACPHVATPQPPTLVMGLPLAEVEALANDNADKAKDGAGRRLRKDAPVLVAGVASFPVPLANMTEQDRQRWRRWEADTLVWLRQTFGHRVVSAVRHEDERFPHLHFYLAPDLGADGRLDVQAVHPGIDARERCRAEGGDRAAQNRAYCEAMRRMQDGFQRAVGARHGLLRTGPKRRRLTRAAYREVQRQAQERAAMLERIEMTVSEAERLRVAAVEAPVLRASVQALQEQNARLANKLAETKRVITQKEHETARLLAKVRASGPKIRHCAKVLTGVIRLVATGDDEYRAWLAQADCPAVVDESDWTLLRSLLRRPGWSLRQRGLDDLQR